MRRLILVVMLLAVVGCKSDAEKLAELRQRENLARLFVFKYEQQSFENVRTDCLLDKAASRGSPVCARQTAVDDSLAAAKLQLDLIQRDINRFMSD